ncbi:MAG: helix-turn-helix domain-containing protein [Lachnospiraceae bacterium]|nr:helix-turn-helix domain-containing protein [Lachnospiraceae bacterium]
MNERLKILRESLGLSQEEFGNRIGSARNTIANYEIGRRNPSNTVVKSICREFRVNYFWLTEGKGDMWCGTPQDVVDEIAEDYNLDDLDKKIIQKYLELNAGQRQVLKDYLKSIFE